MIYRISDKIIDILLVFMLVTSSGGMLFVTVGPYDRNIASLIFLFSLLVVLFIFGKPFKKLNFNSSCLTLFSFVAIGTITYSFSVYDQEIRKYLFYLLSCFISVGVLFHFNNNREKNVFIRILYVVLKIVALHATVNFFLFFIISNNLIELVSQKNEIITTYQTFSNLFFYQERSVEILFGIEFCRNQGLFTEPGVLQIYLNLLFFLEAFIIRKNKSILLLSGFLILTTYSTTGLFLFFLQSVFYLTQVFFRNKLMFPFILAVLFPLYFILSSNFVNKFEGEKEASFQKRLFDLTQPFFIALENPLTGIGLDVYKFQEFREEFYVNSPFLNSIYQSIGVEQKLEFSSRGSSNSIMSLLASTGFPITILLMFIFFKQKIIVNKKRLWIILLLLSVVSQPLLLRPFFLIFMVSGFNQFFNKILINKKQFI